MSMGKSRNIEENVTNIGFDLQPNANNQIEIKTRKQKPKFYKSVTKRIKNIQWPRIQQQFYIDLGVD